MNDLTAGGSGWALASPDRRASEAGAAVFRDGGNAVDAALAAAAMLTVVYPHQCAIGGDAIALVGTPDGEVQVINGSGRAARAVDPEAIRANHAQMPLTGPLPVTVPGMVSAWTELAARWGHRPLGDALTRAAAAAAEGVAVAPGLARELVLEQRQLARDPGTAAIFLGSDGPLPVGGTLHQPQLAATLTELAADPAGMYQGPIADAVTDRLRALGSALTTEDFAAHRTTVEPCRSVRFGDDEYLSAGANSQGLFFLTALRGLDAVQRALGRVPDPLGPDAGVISEILRRTALDRDQFLGDPEHVEVPQDWLLSDERAAELAELAITAGSSSRSGPAAAAVRRPGDTVAIVAVDREGNWVSLIQSLFHAFGAVVLDPVTGVLLHNRGASFSLDPSAAGRLAGGRRPPHTLMPVLVRRAGQLIGAHGTMGGRAQPTIHAQLALHLALGRSPAEAVQQPRWVLGAIEADVPDAARTALRRTGDALVELPSRDDSAGHAQLVRRAGDQLAAATDPRADGSAVAGSAVTG